MHDVTELHVRIGTQVRTYRGRVAWALFHLVGAGEAGCTPLDHIGPRWSHYVLLLRKDGINIETVYERHGGAFSGNHARYILRTPVEIISLERAA